MKFEILVRTGVSALVLGVMSQMAYAEDTDTGVAEPEVIVGEEITGWEDGEVVILIDDTCIDCSGEIIEEDGGEGEPGDGGEEPGWEAWSGEGEGGGDGSEEPVEYLEDGEVPDGVTNDGEVTGEPEYFPTSTCGGCEAWSDRGNVVSYADDGVSMSDAYRNALCTDPAFRGVSECEGFVAD
jgi:hypothetical protein